MVRLIFLFIFLTTYANADVLFEGYFKILSGGVHSGFVISRYEFNPKTKQFISTYYLRTNPLAGDAIESYKAFSTDTMVPISLQYTGLIGKDPIIVDVKFAKNKMTGINRVGKKETKIVNDIPKGAFLSTFLSYVMLQSKEGLKVGAKYEFQAIAEEDGQVHKGMAFIEGQEEFQGIKSFKVINEFKGIKYISYINERGEMLATKSPTQGIEAMLVSKPSEATGEIKMDVKAINSLFGGVPVGNINVIYKKYAQGTVMDQNLVPGKQTGVPASSNLQPNPGVKPETANQVVPGQVIQVKPSGK